ncbi:MAG: hypothetical protein ACXWES_07455 [Solirubrobacterales bacterium]
MAAELQLNLNAGSLDLEGQRAGLALLAGFLLSFGFIRMSTRLMRSPKVPWWPGSIKIGGGLHVHHLVFGIVLIMLTGFLGFALQPDSPWTEILAGLFGIGVGLTIDEFALWLHLEDVYWTEQGRSSVDAMIVATIIGGGFVLGLAPFGTDDGQSVTTVVVIVLFHLAVITVAALKGKIVSVLAGMFVPPIAYVAAIRLARPGSRWARKRYPPGSEKLAEATEREERHRRRYRRIQDLIGGRPSTAGN